MKKVILFFVGLFLVALPLSFACSGTVYPCGNVLSYVADAQANCPGGSSITYIDYCTGESGTINIIQ